MYNEAEPFISPTDFDVDRKVLMYSTDTLKPIAPTVTTRTVSRRGLLKSKDSDVTILKTKEHAE